MTCRVIRICRNQVTFRTVPGSNTTNRQLAQQAAETIRRLRSVCGAEFFT